MKSVTFGVTSGIKFFGMASHSFGKIVFIAYKALYDLFQVQCGRFWSSHGRTASDGLASAPSSSVSYF